MRGSLACTWWLNESGERPSQVAVPRQAGTDVKMTSEGLRSLERKGAAGPVAGRTDARARRLVVSRKGKILAPKAISVVEAVDAEFFRPIS